MSTSDKRSSEKPRPQDAPVAGSADFEYQAAAQRNRMMALWAADKMGLRGDGVESYARAVVRGGTEQPSEEDVIRKILGDLVASNISVRESEVRTKAAEFLAQAREALKN